MRHLTPYRRESLWDFMSDVERALDGIWQPSREFNAMSTFIPPVDLREDKDNFFVNMDLPGMAEADLNINVENGRLTVSGERSREDKSEDGMFKRYERSFGRFERSFQLPQNVDEEKIEAHFDKGVLELKIPKSETAKPRKILIGEKKSAIKH